MSYIGRKVKFRYNGVEVPGVREKGVTYNGEPIDITSDDDDGIRALLSEPGERSLNISVSGVIKTDVMKNDFMTGVFVRSVEVEWPNGSKIVGNFFRATYSEGNPYKEAATFQADFQSTGDWTFTPAT